MVSIVLIVVPADNASVSGVATDQITGAVVDLTVLAAVVFTPVGVVAAAVIYWIDLVVRLLRQFCVVAFAAPRETYSPTEQPAIPGNGDPGPFRFLIPKLGGVRLTDRLPAATPYNLRVASLLSLWLPLLGFTVAGTVVNTETPLMEPAAVRALAVLTGVIVARHSWELRQFLRADRPTVKQMGLLAPGLSCLFAGGLVVLADAVAANVAVGVPTASTFVVGAGVVRAVYSGEASHDSEPITLSEPNSRPTERFRADRRATRVAGMLDGLLPRVRFGVFNLWARFVGVFLPAVGVFWGVLVVGLSLPVALLIGGGGTTVVVGGAFVLSGVAHFELAFGAVEYRLYDEELVAYDTRLDAVQWRAPLAEIHNVTVTENRWLSPPGTDAGTVQLERSGMETTARPYGFVRQSLVCVTDPERVADRLRRVTVEKTRQVGRSDDVCGMPPQQ